MQQLIYKYPDEFGFVIILKTLIDTMHKYRQVHSNIPESGGILLGYRRGAHLEITNITTSQPNDINERFKFIRKDPYHINFAKNLWNESNGYIDYVGEWHTHPERFPSPSHIDLYYWKKLKTTNKDDHMIGIIVGQGSDWIGKITNEAISPLSKL